MEIWKFTGYWHGLKPTRAFGFLAIFKMAQQGSQLLGLVSTTGLMHKT